MPTPAERKAFAKYQAEHIKVYRIKLNDRTDEELIRHLDSLDNVQGYIKALIRADIKSKEESQE